MLIGRVTNRKSLLGYIEGALYCSGKCVCEWLFVQEKAGGGGALVLQLLMSQQRTYKEIYNCLMRSLVDSLQNQQVPSR